MAGFRFTPYSSRFSGTIAEMIQAPARARANALRQVGEIQARAAQTQGQIGAQTAQTLGQIASGAINQYAQYQQDAPRREAEQLQLQAAKRSQADVDALDQAFASGADVASVLDKLPGHLRPGVMKQFQEANEQAAKTKKLKADAQEAEADYLGRLAASVTPYLKDTDGGLTAARIALRAAKEAGYDDADQVWAQIKADPSKLSTIINGLIQKSPEQSRLAREAAAEAEKARHNMTVETEAARHNKAMETKPPTVGSFEHYVIAKFGQNPTPQQIEQARKAYGQADDRALRPIVPVVIQTSEGPKILDRSSGTVRGITDASGKDVQPAPTADMRNKAEARKLVGNSINAIETLSKQVITKRGVAQRAVAAGRSVEAALGNDPQYRVYQDARMALAGNLAVGQQGSRPSDADIKAIWLPMVPDVFRDTDESAAMKWNLIKTMSNVTPGQGAGAAPTHRFNPETGKVEGVK